MKISEYSNDSDIQGTERLLATDTNGDTINILLSALTTYLDGEIGGGGGGGGGGATELTDLTDVSSASPALGNFLIGNGSTYAGRALVSGDIPDLSATYAAASHTHIVDDISATGTADNTTYLRGDGVWAVPPGSGGGGASQLSDLSDVQSAATTNRFALMANGAGEYVGRALVINDISDLSANYIQKGAIDLDTDIGSGTVPVGNVSEASVTQHEAALTITESQISDLQTYVLPDGSVPFTGDVTTSANGSSLGSPRVMGFTNLDGAAENISLQLGDAYSTITNYFGKGSAFKTYNTLYIEGGAAVLNDVDYSGSLYDNESAVGINLRMNNDKSVWVQTTETTPTNSVFAVVNSTDTEVFAVDYLGEVLARNGVYFRGGGTEFIRADGSSAPAAFVSDNTLILEGGRSGLSTIDYSSYSNNSLRAALLYLPQGNQTFRVEARDGAHGANLQEWGVSGVTRASINSDGVFTTSALSADITDSGHLITVDYFETNGLRSDITGLTGATQITNLLAITQAGYDAIGTPDSSTFYFITDAPAYEYLTLAVSDLTSDLAVGTNDGFFPCPYSGTITNVYLDVLTAPTGSAVQVDVNRNGTTIFTTEPTIDATETSSRTAATPLVLDGGQTTVTAGDRFTFDITGVGSTTTGAGLIVTVEINTNA